MTYMSTFYDFGPFRIDTRERVLLCEGRPVALAPKAFQTLLVLVRNSGHLVDKEELIREVWPDTFVEESNLTQNILTLRRVLGELAPGEKYIETVPRRGYRFVAVVSAEAHLEAHETSTLTAPCTPLLAVIPFTTGSQELEPEYLAETLTSTIIRKLADLPQVRVLSLSAVSRYKATNLDPIEVGREREVDYIVVGKVTVLGRSLHVSTEFVDVRTGCQLWGERYERALDLPNEVGNIASLVTAAVQDRLAARPRFATRYTEHPEAYNAYIDARCHWSEYTKDGLTSALTDFRRAMALDPNYSLAYAGIIDCYLRLATNYIPPESLLSFISPVEERSSGSRADAIRLRQKWDQTAAEREIKRYDDMRCNYPTGHQWYAAYVFARDLFEKSRDQNQTDQVSSLITDPAFLQMQTAILTDAEHVQVFCSIAREQIDNGNFTAASAVLRSRWTFGQWPNITSLNANSSADLLFTTGTLAGWLASTRQLPKGQKHAEGLLNGSIALFEQHKLKTQSAEARIELASCYWRQGLFDLARATFGEALDTLAEEDYAIRALGLVRLAIVERTSGDLKTALKYLEQANAYSEQVGPWISGRYYLEYATTLKEIAIAEKRDDLFDVALDNFRAAFREFVATGNHRNSAIVENNHGYLLLALKRFGEAEVHLQRARELFETFSDAGRAQVDETLSRLYIAVNQFDQAEKVIQLAVETLQRGDEDALLVESLTTQGLVLCKLGRHAEAKRALEQANQIASRCGDFESAGLALLIMLEELDFYLSTDERTHAVNQMQEFLSQTRQSAIRQRTQRFEQKPKY